MKGQYFTDWTGLMSMSFSHHPGDAGLQLLANATSSRTLSTPGDVKARPIRFGSPGGRRILPSLDKGDLTPADALLSLPVLSNSV
jgi:hypothetical protein